MSAFHMVVQLIKMPIHHMYNSVESLADHMSCCKRLGGHLRYNSLHIHFQQGDCHALGHEHETHKGGITKFNPVGNICRDHVIVSHKAPPTIFLS